MNRLELSLTINRPAEDVFDFITDPGRMHLWSARLRETQILHSEPGGRGTRIRQVYGEGGRGLVTEGGVTEHRRPERYTLSFSGAKYGLTVDYRIRAGADGSCVFTQTSELDYHGLLSPIIGLLFKMSAHKRMIADLATLKALPESEGAG